jgi:hypothetical protein
MRRQSLGNSLHDGGLARTRTASDSDDNHKDDKLGFRCKDKQIICFAHTLQRKNSEIFRGKRNNLCTFAT